MEDKKNEVFLNLTLDQIMADRFARYSKYIIQERALPDSRDGLKPVQRRILYSMNELGLFYNKSFKKSARVVGDVIGKYHPHGDSSIYEALVRMSQNWKINMELIEMHGNNGSIDDDPAAAMRYTETRLSKISNYLLNNIKKNSVLFAPNFDDSETEPTVLPALFPNLLVNGAKGIAAGYATEMPPHNLGEIINAIIAKIKNPSISLESILKYIKGPDFPTGGVVQNKDGIYQAFKNGKGKILIQAKYKILTLKTTSSIIINEIPYGVIKAKLVREIDEIRFNNKIEGIKNVRDESDRNGLLIHIELSPGIDTNAILNYLLAKTEMQIYYNYNNIAIKNKVPTQMGIINLLDSYLNHQKEVQTKTLNFNLANDKRRYEIVKGLIKVATISEDIINAIKKAPGSKQGVIDILKNNFQFSNIQAEAIAELRLYRLSKTNQTMYLQELEILEKRINKIEEILVSKDKFNHYLIKLLETLKDEHAIIRKTKIEKEISQVVVNMDALIKHEKIWIGITREGYIKRFSNRTYETNNLDNYFIKKNDILIYLQLIKTQYKLIIFTNKGKYFFIPIHKIIETKFKDIGKHINDFAIMEQDEYIIEAIAVKDFNVRAYIAMATIKGKGKRVKISNLQVLRFTKTYKIISLTENDKLASITITNGLKQLIIITKNGKATKYLETELPIQGLKSYGIKAINVDNSEVVSIASGTNQEILGLVSNRGGIKRIKISSIKPMNRTTKGKLLFKFIKSNPHIISNAKVVLPQTNIIFSKNKIITYKFNKVDISSTNEGFSLSGITNDGGLINSYQIINKNDFQLTTSSNLSDDKKFKKAENIINKTSQISIDDLLKDI